MRREAGTGQWLRLPQETGGRCNQCFEPVNMRRQRDEAKGGAAIEPIAKLREGVRRGSSGFEPDGRWSLSTLWSMRSGRRRVPARERERGEPKCGTAVEPTAPTARAIAMMPQGRGMNRERPGSCPDEKARWGPAGREVAR